jgi:hypothetical protein
VDDTNPRFPECLGHRAAEFPIRKIFCGGEVDTPPRSVRHHTLTHLRREHDAFDEICHGDERDAPVAAPVDDVQAGSSDRPEHFVRPGVAGAEHDARPHDRDRQHARVLAHRLLAGELATSIVGDRHRRIALEFRCRARGPHGGDRRDEHEHRAVRLIRAGRRDGLDALRVHPHEVSGAHRPHEPGDVEDDAGLRPRDGAANAHPIIDVANEEHGAGGAQLVYTRRGAHQAAHSATSRNQSLHEVPADKAAGAGDQYGLWVGSVHSRDLGAGRHHRRATAKAEGSAELPLEARRYRMPVSGEREPSPAGRR